MKAKIEACLSFLQGQALRVLLKKSSPLSFLFPTFNTVVMLHLIFQLSIFQFRSRVVFFIAKTLHPVHPIPEKWAFFFLFFRLFSRFFSLSFGIIMRSEATGT
ncbi:MAG: hypothetical protein R2779_04345 [Crocinitomicaceae bacterium]